MPCNLNDNRPPCLVLRLFVTGMTPRSLRAIAQITAICKESLSGTHELEIIDIYQHPMLASENQIIASPTLLKVHPPPEVRLVGELSDRAGVLRSLGVPDLG